MILKIAGRALPTRPLARFFSSPAAEFAHSTHPDNSHVAILTMDRPKAKNALGKQMMSEFTTALTALPYTTPTVPSTISASSVPCPS